VHVLNGEKYKEVCPDNTLLNNAQLRGCIIQPNHKKPLLKRESAMGVAEDTRIFLTVEVRAAAYNMFDCSLTCSPRGTMLPSALVWFARARSMCVCGVCMQYHQRLCQWEALSSCMLTSFCAHCPS
jgi:hypothetical protein